MAKRSDDKHLINISLMSCFVIAVLAIVGMVGLMVQHGSILPDASLQGQAARGFTHRFVGLSGESNVLAFTQLPGTAINVAVSDGSGSLVYKGYEHRFDVVTYGDRLAVRIDTDHDGYPDRFVREGQYFTLK